MYSLLLAIIYIAFISLGLPDSLLGAGWPVMQTELGVPLSYAGIVSMIISGGTIVSSLASDYLTKKLSTGLVTAISVGFTAVALMGFSLTDSFRIMCLWAIPYGLGAGAVDAALNNYVALHYSSRHMSWLHAFWGVGVSISPYVMSYSLSNQLGWQMGYRSISIIQIVLTAILFASVSLWTKNKSEAGDSAEEKSNVTLGSVLKIKGVLFCLAAFLAYCAFELTAGMWASSYMVGARGVEPETAARFAALFWLGETFGRFANGFVADRFGDRTMIKVGGLVMLCGVVMVILPVGTNMIALAGLVVMGFGAAPVYPCIIHSTPTNFGRENSQALVGIQMASAYCGSTFMPPLFGVLAENISLSLYPYYLGVLVMVMIVMTHIMNKKVDSDKL